MSEKDNYWFDLGYEKGKASRDAEVAELNAEIERKMSAAAFVLKEHDKLREQVKLLRDALESMSALGVMAVYNGSPHWIFPIKVMHRSNEALAATDDLKDVILCHAEPVGWCGTSGVGELIVSKSKVWNFLTTPLYRAWEPK